MIDLGELCEHAKRLAKETARWSARRKRLSYAQPDPPDTAPDAPVLRRLAYVTNTRCDHVLLLENNVVVGAWEAQPLVARLFVQDVNRPDYNAAWQTSNPMYTRLEDYGTEIKGNFRFVRLGDESYLVHTPL